MLKVLAIKVSFQDFLVSIGNIFSKVFVFQRKYVNVLYCTYINVHFEKELVIRHDDAHSFRILRA